MISELRQPPPDVPGADRQELLRLLDRRQEYCIVAFSLAFSLAFSFDLKCVCVCVCVCVYCAHAWDDV